MGNRDWIEHVRRDANIAAELAAAAEAALRSMQGTGGTAAERAGVLRVVGMARGTAASAVQQLDTADRLDWIASIERSG